MSFCHFGLAFILESIDKKLLSCLADFVMGFRGGKGGVEGDGWIHLKSKICDENIF